MFGTSLGLTQMVCGTMPCFEHPVTSYFRRVFGWANGALITQGKWEFVPWNFSSNKWEYA